MYILKGAYNLFDKMNSLNANTNTPKLPHIEGQIWKYVKHYPNDMS